MIQQKVYGPASWRVTDAKQNLADMALFRRLTRKQKADLNRAEDLEAKAAEHEEKSNTRNPSVFSSEH
jgi:hypothetical protein